MATLTIRAVRDFEHRNVRNFVLKDVDLANTNVGQLKEKAREEILNSTARTLKPIRDYCVNLDTLKIYTHAHGSKTTNLVINTDKPEWVLDDPTLSLSQIGLSDESELSFYNSESYEDWVQRGCPESF